MASCAIHRRPPAPADRPSTWPVRRQIQALRTSALPHAASALGEDIDLLIGQHASRALAKAGINLPVTPFAIIVPQIIFASHRQIYRIGKIKGRARFVPFSPWQATQFCLYRVAKSSTWSGRTTSGSGPGRRELLQPRPAQAAVTRSRNTEQSFRCALSSGPSSSVFQLGRYVVQREPRTATLETAPNAPSLAGSPQSRPPVRMRLARQKTIPS